jgi:hypothetical protein
MLSDNDVVTDGEPKSGAFSGRLRCEERVEHLFLHVGRNAGAVVANPDFHMISKASCRGRKGWFIAITISLSFTLCRGVKSVGDQIEQDSCDVLREDIGLAGGRVQ